MSFKGLCCFVSMCFWTDLIYSDKHRKMLTKGKKPEPKEEAKDAPEAPPAPVRAETPRLLRAALEMTERSSGLKGALAKVKEKTNKSSISLQVHKNLGKLKNKHAHLWQ